MDFCIATVAFWQSHGFDTSNWRKSTDGTLALVHKEYALVLVPDVDELDEVQVYRSPSAELDGVLGGVEWSNKEAEVWN
jgi:hypothetical protein